MFNFLKKNTPTLEEIMKEYSKRAIEHAKRFDTHLDFSDESISNVERVLDILYNSAKKESPSEQDYTVFANTYGAYIGETLIKKLGKGSWTILKDGDFAGALALQIDDRFTFFPAKVYRRLKNGAEDNVEHLYLSCIPNNALYLK